MEDLKLTLELLHKALKTLKRALTYSKKVSLGNDIDAIEASEDSIIQRFEYSYESFWKFLKKYLEFKYNIEDINSPKGVFRTCVKHELCSPEEGELLINMVDHRNETTHSYDVEKVRKILPEVESYYICMMTVLKRIEDALK